MRVRACPRGRFPLCILCISLWITLLNFVPPLAGRVSPRRCEARGLVFKISRGVFPLLLFPCGLSFSLALRVGQRLKHVRASVPAVFAAPAELFRLCSRALGVLFTFVLAGAVPPRGFPASAPLRRVCLSSRSCGFSAFCRVSGAFIICFLFIFLNNKVDRGPCD